MNEQERNTVAYHESGHALVAELVPHGDPVSKISIVPHSRGALGYTMQMPTEDRYLLSIDELQDRIAVMLGGRAGELVDFATITAPGRAMTSSEQLISLAAWSPSSA